MLKKAVMVAVVGCLAFLLDWDLPRNQEMPAPFVPRLP